MHVLRGEVGDGGTTLRRDVLRSGIRISISWFQFYPSYFTGYKGIVVDLVLNLKVERFRIDKFSSYSSTISARILV